MISKSKVKSGRSLWNRDYSEIDIDLIGSDKINQSNISLPNNMVNKFKTTEEIIKKYSSYIS